MNKIEKLATELFKELFNQKVKIIEKENNYLEWLNIVFENDSRICLGKEGNIICNVFLTDFLNKEELRKFASEQYEMMLPITEALRIQNLKEKKEQLKQEIKDIEKELKDGKQK